MSPVLGFVLILKVCFSLPAHLLSVLFTPELQGSVRSFGQSKPGQAKQMCPLHSGQTWMDSSTNVCARALAAPFSLPPAAVFAQHLTQGHPQLGGGLPRTNTHQFCALEIPLLQEIPTEPSDHR